MATTTRQAPVFNLKAVVQETGIKPDTLRAWERRYGLPDPQRSRGGHRLYSQRDISIIKWLMARQREGLSIKQAVELWRQFEADGQDPLQVRLIAPRAAIVPALPAEGDALAGLREAWIAACLAFDEPQAELVLAQAFALYPPEVVGVEVLQKGLAEVGDRWYRGQVTVQQEHFTSELAMRRLETLVAAAPPPTRSQRILVGCPPEEQHTFSPLLVTFLLRRRGWEVLYLGANVPVARMEAAITTTRPQLVILSAQQLHTAATLLAMARLLQGQRIPLGYGGLIFNLLPGLRARIPGYFLGERLDLVPQVIEQLLSSLPPLPPVEAASDVYQQALSHYRERQALIEAQVWQTLAPTGMPYEHLATANLNLASNVIAALTLGDVDLLGVDVAWVQGLLVNFGVSTEWLHCYLDAYHRAARTYLDERGAPVVQWLARVTERQDEIRN